MTRLESNIKILNITKQLAYMFPDMRFIQLLTTIDAILGTDQFYEESEVTLNRIKEKIEYQQRATHFCIALVLIVSLNV